MNTDIFVTPAYLKYSYTICDCIHMLVDSFKQEKKTEVFYIMQTP